MPLHQEPEVVLLLGAPGAGKGTQARYLAEALGLPHVASGDLLRDHRRRGTDLGHKAEAYMDRGDLVPDSLVVAMIRDRMEEPDAAVGVLLDGFPRTMGQAKALDEMLAKKGTSVNRALYLRVPMQTLIDRLSGRWICRECHTSYHTVFNPSPAGPTTCGVCGGELYQREDDKREVVAARLKKFMDETQPMIDYYEQLGVLRFVDGDRPIDQVRHDLASAARENEKQSAWAPA